MLPYTRLRNINEHNGDDDDEGNDDDDDDDDVDGDDDDDDGDDIDDEWHSLFCSLELIFPSSPLIQF